MGEAEPTNNIIPLPRSVEYFYNAAKSEAAANKSLGDAIQIDFSHYSHEYEKLVYTASVGSHNPHGEELISEYIGIELRPIIDTGRPIVVWAYTDITAEDASSRRRMVSYQGYIIDHKPLPTWSNWDEIYNTMTRAPRRANDTTKDWVLVISSTKQLYSGKPDMHNRYVYYVPFGNILLMHYSFKQQDVEYTGETRDPDTDDR